MPEFITLDEAATKLGLFYTELMDVLDKVFVTDYVDHLSYGGKAIKLPLSELDKHPSTSIPYDYLLQIQQYLKIETLPNYDPRQDTRPDIDRLSKYQDRLKAWKLEWQVQNKAVYKKWYKANKGYNMSKGFKLPPSFKDMFYWLNIYYSNKGSDRPECYLTRPFQEDYFEEYHYAHIKTRKYELTNLEEKLSQNVPQSTKHWAYYWYFLSRHEGINNGSLKLTPYFEQWGLSKGINGKHIYQSYKLMVEENEKSKAKLKGQWKIHLTEAIKLLHLDNYLEAAKAAQLFYDKNEKK